MKSSREFKRSSPLSRHKQLMKEYLQRQTKPATYTPASYKTERDILKENHRFVRSEEDDDNNSLTWEQRVAKKYYDTLFKEYALCELKYYKDGKIALRWRTEKEVLVGKGQFICASTRCDASDQLKSWEVNFGYVEDGEKKNELVKVRLCPECSDKLNYRTKKRAAKTLKRSKQEEKEHHKSNKKRRRTSSSSSPSPEEDSAGEERSDDDDKLHTSSTQEASIWSKPLDAQHEKSKEEEYEDYFADLLQ